jgi:hypothetical protein
VHEWLGVPANKDYIDAWFGFEGIPWAEIHQASDWAPIGLRRRVSRHAAVDHPSPANCSYRRPQPIYVN